MLTDTPEAVPAPEPEPASEVPTSTKLRAALSLMALVLGLVGLGLFVRAPEEPPAVVVVDAGPNDSEDAPFVFSPENTEVAVGSTIEWVNKSETFHSVTFSAADAPLTPELVDGDPSNKVFDETFFDVGPAARHTFETAGVQTYYCEPHSSFMTGSITVVDKPNRQLWLVGGVVALALAALLAVASVAVTRLKTD